MSFPPSPLSTPHDPRGTGAGARRAPLALAALAALGLGLALPTASRPARAQGAAPEGPPGPVLDLPAELPAGLPDETRRLLQRQLPSPDLQPGRDVPGQGNPQGEAMLRLVHALPGQGPLALAADGQEVQADAPGRASPRLAVTPPGREELRLRDAAGGSTPRWPERRVDAGLERARDYSAVAYGDPGAPSLLLLEDDARRPAAGFARLRLAHVAPGLPRVTVATAGGTEIAAHLVSGAASGYAELPGGAADLELRAGDEVLLRAETAWLRPGSVLTAYLLREGGAPALRLVEERAYPDETLPPPRQGGRRARDETAPPGAPALFDIERVRDIELEFLDPDWRTLLDRRGDEARDLEARLLVDGQELGVVGARYKGNTSRQVRGDKKPFNITTDAFVDGQDLWGFDVINLNNGYADPSMLREAIAFTMLRDYLPTPRASFARVSVQGDFLGVYLMVEQINGEHLRAWFPDGDGLLVKADPPTGAALDTSGLRWIGEDPEVWRRAYEPKRGLEDDEALRRVRELSRVLAAPLDRGGVSQERRLAAVGQQLDVESALWYLAGSNLIVNGDSYYAGHNYYLYETTRDRRWNLLTWDLNMSFGVFPMWDDFAGRGGAEPAESEPFSGTQTEGRPILQQLLTLPELRADYAAHLRTLRDEVLDPARMAPLGRALQDRIREDVRAEPDPIYPFSEFQANLEEDVVRNNGRRESRTPGVLKLAADRHAFLRAHPALQAPALALREAGIQPDAPSSAEAVDVTARFQPGEGEGLDSVQLRYRVGGDAERVLPMRRDGDAWHGRIPAQRGGAEVSWVLRAGLDDGRASFFPAATLTRPFTYTVAGARLPDAPPGAPGGALRINELLADNQRGLRDEQGEHEDWLELFNEGSDPVSLAGLFLSDDEDDPWRYALPDRVLAPGAHLLVFCDGEPDEGPLHAPFALSRRGETLTLATEDAILERVTFGALGPDEAHARESDGAEAWTACPFGTPGRANRCPAWDEGRLWLPWARTGR